MAKRSRLAAEVLSLAESLKCKDKLISLREEEIREVDLEMAAALGIDREKAAKIACRIRSASTLVHDPSREVSATRADVLAAHPGR